MRERVKILARREAIAKFIFTVVFSVALTGVGALSLMLGLEFLNDFYDQVIGLSYIVCFIIVLALRGLYWSISTDVSDWFDKANHSL